MTARVWIRAAAVAALGFAITSAAQAVEVSRSALISAPPAKVWEIVGDYGTLDTWHPAVVKLELSGDEASGLFRLLTLPDGGTLNEKLIERSDQPMFYSYAIESGVLPVRNYVATLSVSPAKHDASMSVVQWSSSFDPVGLTDKEATDLIGGIYVAGFKSVLEKLK